MIAEDSEGTEKTFVTGLVWIISGQFVWVLALLIDGGSCLKPRQRPPHEFALVLRANFRVRA